MTLTLNPSIDRVIETAGLFAGGHVGGKTIARVCAGKGVNVSKALAALGTTSDVVALVGSAEREQFEQAIESWECSPRIIEHDGRTRENVTIIDTESGSEAHIRDEGPALSEFSTDLALGMLRIARQDDALPVICGSLPRGIDPHQMLRLLEHVGLRCLNYAISGSVALIRAFGSVGVGTIAVNENEWRELTGESVSLDDAGGVLASAQQFRRAAQPFTEAAIVTLGERGAIFVDSKWALHAEADIDRSFIRSTVGCGDALLAGFLHATVTGRDPKDALRLAVAAGSAAAMTDEPAHIDPALVAELEPAVKLTPLA